jgi:hypothetical protein
MASSTFDISRALVIKPENGKNRQRAIETVEGGGQKWGNKELSLPLFYYFYAIDCHCQCQGKFIHKHDSAALAFSFSLAACLFSLPVVAAAFRHVQHIMRARCCLVMWPLWMLVCGAIIIMKLRCSPLCRESARDLWGEGEKWWNLFLVLLRIFMGFFYGVLFFCVIFWIL